MTGATLPVTLRLDDRPVLLCGEGEPFEAKRRLLERAGAILTDDPDAARIAIVAYEDAALRDAAVARLRAGGLLLNVVDQPDACDFTLPAIVDRDPLTVSVATGGVSAGLAAAVRQRIEPMLPARLGQLARQLEAAKPRLRARFPDGGERRRAIGTALAPGEALDAMADHDDDAVARWIDSGCAAPPDRVVAIRIDSPDPDDLRLRDSRALGLADRIYHRADVPPAILDRARADAVRIACDRVPDAPGHGLSIDLGVAR